MPNIFLIDIKKAKFTHLNTCNSIEQNETSAGIEKYFIDYKSTNKNGLWDTAIIIPNFVLSYTVFILTCIYNTLLISRIKREFNQSVKTLTYDIVQNKSNEQRSQLLTVKVNNFTKKRFIERSTTLIVITVSSFGILLHIILLFSSLILVFSRIDFWECTPTSLGFISTFTISNSIFIFVYSYYNNTFANVLNELIWVKFFRILFNQAN